MIESVCAPMTCEGGMVRTRELLIVRRTKINDRSSVVVISWPNFQCFQFSMFQLAAGVNFCYFWFLVTQRMDSDCSTMQDYRRVPADTCWRCAGDGCCRSGVDCSSRVMSASLTRPGGRRHACVLSIAFTTVDIHA